MSARPSTNLELVEEVTVLAQRGDRQSLYELVDGRVHPNAEWTPLIAICEMELRGQESGVEITAPIGTVYEFKGELLRRDRVYDDQAAAEAAAHALAAGEWA